MSITSSEWDSDCSCNRAANLTPFKMLSSNAVPFFGRPLVYYAEVPELHCAKLKVEEKNHKPNYFVKAFRWYTQEHGGVKKTAPCGHCGTKDIGFAHWLDQKYEQYLCDSRLKTTRRSNDNSCYLGSTACHPGETPKSDKPKGLQKLFKSPWKKRGASGKSTDGEKGDTQHTNNCKCKPSWQVILRPKSTTRLPSEVYTQKGPRLCCECSKATIASSDTQLTGRAYLKTQGIVVEEISARTSEAPELNNVDKKRTVKTKSLNSQHTYVLPKNYCAENVKSERPVEPKETAEDDNYKCKNQIPIKNEMPKDDNIKIPCPIETNERTKQENVTWQYPVPKETAKGDKKDASMQYEQHINKYFDSITTTQVTCKPSEQCGSLHQKDTPAVTKNTFTTSTQEEHIEIDIATGDKNQNQYASKLCQKGPNCCHAYTKHGSTTVQTSDYALTLENMTMCGVPLLVRIVNARKSF